jgi:hypothetical protein
MQVKISYTAELSDVPKEVSNILKSIEVELDKSHRDLQRAIGELSENEISDAKANMNMFKTRLQKMFARLADCQVVLEGYEDVINKQSTPKSSVQQEKSVE